MEEKERTIQANTKLSALESQLRAKERELEQLRAKLELAEAKRG